MRKALVSSLICAATVFAGAAQAQQKSLTIWWAKGFYESEDVAIRKVVDAFQTKTGIKVDLSLFSIEDANTKAISAVEAGSPPDVGFGASYDFSARGKWAFDGRLEDVSDIVTPLKSDLLPVAADSMYLQNGKTGKRAYYAVPIAVANNYIFYWRDMLKEAGFEPSDVPTAWAPYWDFWCGKVQTSLRSKGKRVYGVGNPTSVAAGDTPVEFLTFLAGYGVQPVDANGKMTLDDPAARAGLVKAMTDYINIYQRGCTPPSSITWLDVDNNNNLHNKTTVMTPNSSLSIPGKYLDEKNEAAYYNNLITARFPQGANGKTIAQPTTVKAAVVFADGKNKAAAREFLKFFAQPENYGPYIEGALGRWVPVSKRALATPFWADGKDPHRKIAAQVAQEPLLPFPTVYDYRFTAVNAENVWGKAMVRIIQDKVPVDRAVDDMVKRIKELLK